MVEELCRCGRTGVHCPHCGKKAFYAVASEAYSVKGVNDTVVEVMKYRCRGCGRTFDDLERGECTAPLGRGRVKKALVGVQNAPDKLQEAAKAAAIVAQRFLSSQSNEANTPKTKPFEIGDDREMIQEALTSTEEKKT